MGAEKLDAAAYTWAALNALEEMAGIMGDAQSAAQARAKISQIEASFDSTWWDAAGGTYAMSLNETDNARLPFPHWAVVTPLEVGLATPAHATATLKTIEASYLNRWGLKHTVGADERVWTLATATLSRAAFRNNRPDLGLQMLAHVAETLDSGSIGLFHELIPDGLCTVQLWSAATFVRGIVEDLMGIQVHADKGALIAPRLPGDWGEVTLQSLSFAGHVLDVRLAAREVEARHVSGPVALSLKLRLLSGAEKDFKLKPGETARVSR
jgi:glycogen debranching enzyme